MLFSSDTEISVKSGLGKSPYPRNQLRQPIYLCSAAHPQRDAPLEQ